MKRFFSRRFLLAVVGLGLATWLCRIGRIDGAVWAYALAITLAGHHAPDWIRAWKGTDVCTPRSDPH